MSFLLSVTLLLLVVLASVSTILHKEYYGEEVVDINLECFLTVLPLEVYKGGIFVIACITVLFTSTFFVLPVL